MPSDLNASENSNSPISTPAKKIKLDAPLIPPTFSGVVNSKEYVLFIDFIKLNQKERVRDSFMITVVVNHPLPMMD